MPINSTTRQWMLALCVATLTACGGSSSDNRSPGVVVVEPPTQPPPVDPCEEDPTLPECDPTEPPPGDTTPSVIPASLENAIYASGETAPDGREIYIIDISELPGGRLDPDGLLLGSDLIFRIEGGALRVSQN